MQSIERYGVVALLFLIVTVAAVLMWGDGDEPDPRRRSVADRGDSKTTSASSAVVGARAAAQRSPLTDEAARSRRTAEATEQPRDRYGVPTGGSGLLQRGNGGAVQGAPGIVPGGSGDERSTEDLGPRPPTAEELRAAEEAANMQLALDRQRERELELQRLEEAAERAEELRGQELAAEREAEQRQRSRQGVPVYVVQKNEVLGKIVQRELGSVKRQQEVIDLNPGLNPDRITEGLKLRMPPDWRGAGAAIATLADTPEPKREAAKPEAPRAPSGSRPYVVKDGESLWRIAERQLGSGGRYREIEALNAGIEGGRIRAGQRIFLPGTEVALASLDRGADKASVVNTRTSTRGKVR